MTLNIASPGNVRAFRAITGLATIGLMCADEAGAPAVMSLVIRRIGHVLIADKAFRYPAFGEMLSAWVDAQQSGSGKAAATTGNALMDVANKAAAGSGVSVGAFVAALSKELPNLVTELVVSSAELVPGESVDDLITLVQSQDIDYFAAALLGFVKLNFDRGTAPLLAAAAMVRPTKAAPKATASGTSAAPSANDPATPPSADTTGSGTTSTTAPSDSAAPDATAPGSTA